MFESLDRIISELGVRFSQLHNLAEKLGSLSTTNLLDEDLNCNLEPHQRDRLRSREKETSKPRCSSSCSKEERSDALGTSRAILARSGASSRRFRPEHSCHAKDCFNGGRERRKLRA